ncbi:MAG: hypothetical protein JJLCMIEE_02838 [Acidimicrobiales bacterium]|nr:MAG: hypothetical protein EDR02_13630 [Actinomycetota bacterium]MBV6509740.1 hypothetical protein [Acidimicrobiales bacterium]RIK04866.1 MAG: hypothetical protein DCC48_12570 [Acidobacteriota bacterium]
MDMLTRVANKVAVLLPMVVLLGSCALIGANGGTPPSTSVPDEEPDQGEGEEPIHLGLSIHVEGFVGEDTIEQRFSVHRDMVLELATDAYEHGAVVTFELGPSFVAGVANFDDDVLAQLTSMGHSIAVHADAGGSGVPTLEEFTAELTEQREALAAVGYEVSHVSGICSRGPWVEAAIQAGFSSVSGGVEYCLTSLAPENMPAGYEWVYECSDPSTCHGEVSLEGDQQVEPWRTSDSSNWLLPDPAGGLVYIPGAQGVDFSCIVGRNVNPCSEADEDIATYLTALEEALAVYDGDGTAVFTVTWSFGDGVPDGYADDFFAATESYVSSGDAAWAGLDDVAALVP